MNDKDLEPRGPNKGDGTAPSAKPALTAEERRITWAFTTTTFLSALLLFSIQPMFAKMVLPVLGGAPSVWAVAMFFFQSALLAGYCYAHLVIARLPVKSTGWIHLGLFLLAFLSLPIGLPLAWGEPPAGEPYLWQLGLFTVALGLPFLAVSANAPLLQAWFASTGHRDARNPYFLYAASNLGSMIALLGYPFLLEPAFGLTALSQFWTVGFVALGFAIAGLHWIVRSHNGGMVKIAKVDASPRESASAMDAAIPKPGWSDRLGWVGLALVPSALLTALTTHITTDIASAPMLWVIPLSIYLLTFVLVFREKPWLPDEVMLALHRAGFIVLLLVLSQTFKTGVMTTGPLAIVAFFAAAMVAHRTLYLQRPHARHLTEFYLWMSVGGALGGLSAALLAPKLFSEVLEFPILLAASMACRPGALKIFDPARFKSGRTEPTFKNELMVLWVILAAGVLAIYWMPWAFDRLAFMRGPWPAYAESTGIMALLLWPINALRDGLMWTVSWSETPVIVFIGAVLLMFNYNHPFRQVVAAAIMCLAVVTLPSQVKKGDSVRSYFGVYRVQTASGGEYNILVHGTTLHGAQRVRDIMGQEVADITPGTYYYPGSPMAKSIAARRGVLEEQEKNGRYGIIGLGTGSLACYEQAGESWRYYEIDPVMVDIATKSGNFTFMENCSPNADVVIGDARLTMAKEQDGSFDLIIVDAFSSDAVPVHLMTAEAMQMYAQKLAPGGIVLLHISNRYLDLDGVVGATLATMPDYHGLIAWDDTADGSYGQSSSTVAVFAHKDTDLAPYKVIGTIGELPTNGLRPWTDDFSDILGPFTSKYRKVYGSN